MKNGFQNILLFIVLITSNSLFANLYNFKDADNFAQIAKHNLVISSELIQVNYIDVGSLGIDIFTPGRIIDASNMSSEINKSRSDYNKAINICLPAAKELKKEAEAMLHRVKKFMGQTEAAPVYLLFGANNSGGTASDKGLSLGLEVLCRFADTKEQFKDVLMAFIAHEIVHVYQYQARLYSNTTNTVSSTLLDAALVEGTADFVANIMLGKISEPERERHEYGLNNEMKVWLDFKEAMKKKDFTGWFYSKGINGSPNDMGYWVGKRIAESYYENSKDKEKAIYTLLTLGSAKEILAASLYPTRFE